MKENNNMSNYIIPITVAYGDGIGPEIMESALLLLRESGANIRVEALEIGSRIYNMGAEYGILPSAWDMLKRNKILLKSPIIVPDNATQKNTDEKIYEKFSLSAETLTIYNKINIGDAEILQASQNISEEFALFETMHDAAPDIAGKDIANPCAIIQASILMLKHIGQSSTASLIENALMQTIADGIHTTDIYSRSRSKKKVGTKEFTDEVVARLGR